MSNQLCKFQSINKETKNNRKTDETANVHPFVYTIFYNLDSQTTSIYYRDILKNLTNDSELLVEPLA